MVEKPPHIFAAPEFLRCTARRSHIGREASRASEWNIRDIDLHRLKAPLRDVAARDALFSATRLTPQLAPINAACWREVSRSGAVRRATEMPR